MNLSGNTGHFFCTDEKEEQNNGLNLWTGCVVQNVSRQTEPEKKKGMERIDDKELITGLQDPNRRKAAFGKVVSAFSEPLYWQIRRMVLDHDDANDVLQNTFIKAWTNLEQFKGEAKFSTWIYRICINETLNFLQRQKDVISLDEEKSQSVANRLMSDEYFDGDETEAQLQQAMAELPEKQRLVFQMKYYEEMKYEDMSELLQTSVGALKASYHHAVKKISEFFERHD